MTDALPSIEPARRPSTARVAFEAAALVAVYAPSAVLIADALPILRASDVALKRRFEGAAYEDIFGFGFWAVWAILAAVVFASFVLVWRRPTTILQRSLALVAIVAFAATSLLDHQAYDRLLALWQSHASAK